MSKSEGVPPVADPSWERERGPSLRRALWRYRVPVVCFAALSAAVGYVYSVRQPEVYEAAGRITFASPFEQTLFRQELGVPFTEIDRYLNTQANLVRSPQVIARASELTGGEFRPAEIRQSIAAEPSTDVLELAVRARNSDPMDAANVVNAVTAAFQEVARQRVDEDVATSVAELDRLQAEIRASLDALSDADDPSVESERDGLSSQLAELEAKAGQIRANAAVFGAGVERVDEAAPPEVSLADSPRRQAAIFGVLGFIVALVVAFWRSERTQVIDTADDAAGAVDAPLLGELPVRGTDAADDIAPVHTSPGSRAARDYEFIASTLGLAAPEREMRLVLVISPDPGRAKSVTALNIALSAAHDQRTVILVDADDSGVLTSLLEVGGSSGTSNVVALHAAGRGVTLPDGLLTPIEQLDSFRFMPIGTRDRGDRGAAESPHMGKVLAQLQQEADLVFVDGPALAESPGGMKLAAGVDGVILVVHRGTTIDEVRQARAMLATARAQVVGVVFDQSRGSSRWLHWGRRERWLPHRQRWAA